jgi:hypothetical protein
MDIRHGVCCLFEIYYDDAEWIGANSYFNFSQIALRGDAVHWHEGQTTKENPLIVAAIRGFIGRD